MIKAKIVRKKALKVFFVSEKSNQLLGLFGLFFLVLAVRKRKKVKQGRFMRLLRTEDRSICLFPTDKVIKVS